jgi:8-oxo-dGTP pyrophosphatase MutT (NUDIX family)
MTSTHHADPSHSVAQPAIPHAATVLLLRESGAGVEVLLTKRAAGLSFMAGLWVFPGGRMEPSDQTPEILARIAADAPLAGKLALRTVHGQPLGLETVLGLQVAACRETFEEAGVLLGRPRSGGSCPPAQIARLAARRQEAASADGFVRLLVEEDLLLDIEPLTYWSHWITPASEKKRFDTHFFAVQVPDDQEASVDRSELTHHAWLSRDEVLERTRNGEMLIAPPTIACLEDVWQSHARHGSVGAMLRAERSRPVPPVLPKFVEIDGMRHVVLPWDPEYADLPGEGCTVAERYPPYLAALPSRRLARFPKARKP